MDNNLDLLDELIAEGRAKKAAEAKKKRSSLRSRVPSNELLLYMRGLDANGAACFLESLRRQLQERRRASYKASPSTWQPTHRIVHLQSQRCRCCGGVSAPFIVFDGVREATAFAFRDRPSVDPEPGGVPLPMLVEHAEVEVQQCGVCICASALVPELPIFAASFRGAPLQLELWG